ncbi:TetR/AcrR family transcriptional regulator [Actinoplanes sp. RD1]|uniref:TetR/AcrR family transcriptional regulator n=1 Tax=Actinoplanes sp. RD1 TaxID=3064538 RepID=UPI002741E0E1|nr:TetR/AcrR family transcriptional regulator [Actinoplanes sp. RD1]
MATLGRPRAKGPSTSGLTTEEDILVGAARLFCEAGYGSVSTHKIAAAAGISQATMYHYFAGKQAILLRLLLATVRPSVAYATALAGRDEPADARLWALCAYDVRLLLSGPENTGALYLLPEVADEAFAEFHAEHARLFAVYHDLVAAVLGTDRAAARPSASLVFGLVESVILRRRAEGAMDADVVAPLIADAALRTLRVPEKRIVAARHA